MMMRHINRRLVLSGLASSGMVLHGHAQEAPVVITARKTSSKLLGPESPSTEHWQFKTAEALPVVRAKQGQELRLRINNELAEEFFLHFFGVRGPSDMMTVQVPAGGADVVFTPPDAGTFWFGPLLNASKQREYGLHGLLIVDEVEPLPYQDAVLLFDDWSLGDDGKIEEDFANLDRAAGEGRFGNWFTVNDTFKPRINLDAEKPARLRVVNVANTRTMNVLFKGAEGFVIARDGQPIVPEPLGLMSLKLAPGQRADLLLTEAQEQVVVALDLFEDVVEAAFLLAPGYGRKTLPLNTRLPLNPTPAFASAVAPRDVPITIEGGIKGGLKSAKVGKDVLDLRAMLEQGLAWSIGGSAGLGSPPLFDAKQGDVLKLSFENKTAFEQALHVHGHVWTADKPLDPAFEGPQQPPRYVDTLIVPTGATASVWMVADNPGTWAIQSLLAERSDAGLIGAFTVSDMP
jgi:FtsP/CotA-like multicopper oxidase with cupredoxin domain